MNTEPWKDPIKARISAAWSSRRATMADRQRLMQIKKRWVLDGIAPCDADEVWILGLITNASAPVAAPGEAAACAVP